MEWQSEKKHIIYSVTVDSQKHCRRCQGTYNCPWDKYLVKKRGIYLGRATIWTSIDGIPKVAKQYEVLHLLEP